MYNLDYDLQEIVHSYLNRNYIIENNLLDEIMEKKSGNYKWYLLDELADVFSISKDNARTYVNTWAVSLKPDVCLSFYWGYSAHNPKDPRRRGQIVQPAQQAPALAEPARPKTSPILALQMCEELTKNIKKESLLI